MMDKDRYVKHPMRNPFYQAPRPKAFYHPSPECNVSDNIKKKSTLSPERYSPPSKQPSPDRRFLEQAGYVEIPTRVSSVSQELNESWPGTERSSMSQITFGKVQTSSRTDLYEPRAYSPQKKGADRSGQISANEAGRSEEEPVLSRYLNRFRYGRPTSREDRSTVHGPGTDFWWRHPTAETRTRKSSPGKPTQHSSPQKREKTQSPPVRDAPTPKKQATPEKRQKSVERPSRSRYKVRPDGAEKENRQPDEPIYDQYTEELLKKTDRLLSWSASTISEVGGERSVPSVSTLRHQRSGDVTPRDDDVIESLNPKSEVYDEHKLDHEFRRWKPEEYLERLRQNLSQQEKTLRTKGPDHEPSWPPASFPEKRPLPEAGTLLEHRAQFHTLQEGHRVHPSSPKGRSELPEIRPTQPFIPEYRPTRPSPKRGDDILQQWRLKRRMELARESPAFSKFDYYSHHAAYEDGDPSPRKPSPGVHFTPSKVNEKKVGIDLDEKPVRDTRQVDPVLQPASPHKHYLCDLLPCYLKLGDNSVGAEPRTAAQSDDTKQNTMTGRNTSSTQTVRISEKVGEKLPATSRIKEGDFRVDTGIQASVSDIENAATHLNDPVDDVVHSSPAKAQSKEFKSTKQIRRKERKKRKKKMMKSSDSETVESEESVVRKDAAYPKRSKKKTDETNRAEEKDKTGREVSERIRVEGEEQRKKSNKRETEVFSSPVKSAVNEVVTEHLFVDSPSQSTAATWESDEDDQVYRDDVLLKQLIGQRQQYIRQLSMIDTLLERLEPERIDEETS